VRGRRKDKEKRGKKGITSPGASVDLASGLGVQVLDPASGGGVSKPFRAQVGWSFFKTPCFPPLGWLVRFRC